MTPEQIESLEKGVTNMVKILSMLRLIGALILGCLTVSGSVAVWAYSTTTVLAETRATVADINKERKENTIEWVAWRRVKDENDTRMIAILDAQQKIIDRIERREASR